MTSTSAEREAMSRALALAATPGVPLGPNPRVGCVIAHGSQIVGQGFHVKAGEPHAEVHALRAAGDRARPRSGPVTWSRTPPSGYAWRSAVVPRPRGHTPILSPSHLGR